MRTSLAWLLLSIPLFISGCSSSSGKSGPDNDTDASVVTTTASSEQGPSATTGSDVAGSTTSSMSSTSGPTQFPVSNITNGHKMGIYSWSQDYWRQGDPSLTDFIQSDRGRTWDYGELYINVADYSNYNFIADPDKLVNWMKKWRQASGNDEVIWMTYGDVVEKNGTKMVGFVDTFKNFLIQSVSAQDMSVIGPIGVSFDVEDVPDDFYKEALVNAQQMVQDVEQSQGYPPHSILVGSTIEGEENQLETSYVMQYADRALMMLYRNTVDDTHADDLVEQMQWMMTDQCVICTQPGWENLRAKITIMVEGSCKMGNGCGKMSMCVKDTSQYPDPNGGIEYVWNTLEELSKDIVPAGILTQDQYNKLFLTDGTLFAIHNWDWSRCYFGDDFSAEHNYTNCQDYHSMADTCRGK
ncbi:hypothetical protein FOL47_001296 [Perkinsus chesapeaki]|uniref:Uncharacterized protein n=1 Tax=Perkinsus chesapeaki TaxID=330153 RepID=A0A7J6N3G7_PERCH|nr:hypothetical protein FOL47_001296 [Perkinsus chesapeaki]